MKTFIFLALTALLVSCVTKTPQSAVVSPDRVISSVNDLSGDYLGEGIFSNRPLGKRQPAMRMYLDRAPDNSGAYHGVLVEYQRLMKIAPGYIAANYLPSVSATTEFYLNSISTRISAYKFVPGPRDGKFDTYNMYALKAEGANIVPAATSQMVLHVNSENTDREHPLADAFITGNPEGKISFPVPSRPDSIRDALSVTQFELAAFIYKAGHLKSTWRGNWQDLEGSYLSEYGRLKDGVLELYSEGSQKKMKFKRSGVVADYTHPSSAGLAGDYNISEPIPKMYVLTPVNGTNTPSDKEMNGRIGLFLDVFDASAPEAGSQMVTELAFTNSRSDTGGEIDFMMYYEHPEHKKNIGVEQPQPRKR